MILNRNKPFGLHDLYTNNPALYGLMYHVVWASHYFHVNSSSFLSTASNYPGGSACSNPESLLNNVIFKQRHN